MTEIQITRVPTGANGNIEPLSSKVQAAVAQGWAVESRSEHQVVMVKGGRPNHILHLLLTLLTGGLWGIFVWLPLAIFMKRQRMVLNG
jgi:hypothetical protein